MIDKFGGPNPAPANPHADCKVTNVVQKSNGMSANITCTGQMNATGTVESTYVDANTTKSAIQITGTMEMGGKSNPVDMSMQSTSVYKGPDCGSVKPMTMPTGN
jgi:polyisoprenoid-binding protein YceI